MNKDKYPSREELDEAFHFLHDAINRITVEEEEEEMKMEANGNNQMEKQNFFEVDLKDEGIPS